MPIGPHSNRPEAPQARDRVLLSSLRLGPHGLVVEEEVGEVVLNKVLPRDAKVHRVPVGELTTHVTEDNTKRIITKLPWRRQSGQVLFDFYFYCTQTSPNDL